jgi:ribonuclease J
LPTDEKRLRELGDAGVLAAIADSTNIFREGLSPSEADVAQTLAQIMAKAPHRVAVTTFASNVARLRAVAEAAAATDREVVVVGRAMDRVIDVARERGMLDGLRAFRPASAYGYLPRDKVVALLTGSQGEPRAALARIAADEHPDIALSAGDQVVFSSRTIPGNERGVNTIVNALIRRGVHVITDRTALVHVSGHPRRDEVKCLYEWVRPKILIPAHGEAAHLTEHVAFAKAHGIGSVLRAFNGDVVRLNGSAEIVDKVSAGRLFKDGDIIVEAGDSGISERRKLAFAGLVSIAVAFDAKGQIASDPEIRLSGLPSRTADGEAMQAYVAECLEDVLESLPKAKRRDPDALQDIIARAMRNAVAEVWDKKPTCHVLVLTV